MNKDQLKAAFAKGARIQAWHLLPGATNSNQGQWDTLAPTDGAEPAFYCEAHLYRVHPEDISLIAELGQEVGAVVTALEVFRIAGGDTECSPNPTAKLALDTLKDLRACYDESLTSPAHTSEARDSGETCQFFASGPEGSFFAKTLADAENLIDIASFDRDEWTVTDLHDAAMRQEGGAP